MGAPVASRVVRRVVSRFVQSLPSSDGTPIARGLAPHVDSTVRRMSDAEMAAAAAAPVKRRVPRKKKSAAAATSAEPATAGADAQEVPPVRRKKGPRKARPVVDATDASAAPRKSSRDELAWMAHCLRPLCESIGNPTLVHLRMLPFRVAIFLACCFPALFPHALLHDSERHWRCPAAARAAAPHAPPVCTAVCGPARPVPGHRLHRLR